MKPRTDYTQLAAALNYAELDRKLAQLQEQQPPKKRKRIGDVLAPIKDRLVELHAKGWTYDQLVRELNDFGLPLKSAALRDYLTSGRTKRLRRSHRPRRLTEKK